MVQEIDRGTTSIVSEIVTELEQLVTERLNLICRVGSASMIEADRQAARARVELLNGQQSAVLAYLETLVKPEGHGLD
jgi:hypothetical protein